MISRHEAAQRLDIPVEMARKHGLPARLSESELVELEERPPAWLVQSRTNRKQGGRPVWVQLTCSVCGYTEAARPKKWWPPFSYLSCSHHDIGELPAPGPGVGRRESDGIGSRFIGIVDAPVE
ncbi:MAG: hypothetical protein WED09_00620 [Homoserinimonas sp.]